MPFTLQSTKRLKQQPRRRMGRTITQSIALALILASHCLSAAPYKCLDKGVISYSDRPCQGTTLNLDVPRNRAVPNKTADSPPSSADRTVQAVKKMEAARIQRELEYRISRLERQIVDKKSLNEQTLEKLKEQHDSTVIDDENDDDDVIRVRDMKQSLSQEMQAVIDRQNAEVEQLSKQINVLRSKLRPAQH